MTGIRIGMGMGIWIGIGIGIGMGIKLGIVMWVGAGGRTEAVVGAATVAGTGAVVGLLAGVGDTLYTESHPAPISAVWMYTSNSIDAKNFNLQLPEIATNKSLSLYIIIRVHSDTNRAKKLLRI